MFPRSKKPHKTKPPNPLDYFIIVSVLGSNVLKSRHHAAIAKINQNDRLDIKAQTLLKSFLFSSFSSFQPDIQWTVKKNKNRKYCTVT